MKLLVFAHVPPPHNGQSHEVELMLAAFGGDARRRQPAPPAGDGSAFECYHVNVRFSAGRDDPGRLRVGKLLRLLGSCFEAVWCRFRYGVTNFYYVPAAGGWGALYCDWLALLVCRPFFKKTIFHWQQAGLARWLETAVQIRTRSVTYRLMKSADLSIVPAAGSRLDAEKLLPLRLEIVAGGVSHLAQLAQCLRRVESPAPEPLRQRDGPRFSTGDSSPAEFQTGPAPVRLKLALTILAENPSRKTGLSSLFHELVSRSLRLFPEVSWLIFAGPNQEWRVADPRVEVIRDFPANDRLNRRIFADHFLVPAAARQRGADALLTVGFVPTRKHLPTVMHVLSLQTLDKRNRLGLLRQFYRNSMIKYNWPRADLVITNSRWTADQVLSLYPEFQDRLVISYEGLQHEIFHPRAPADEPRRLREKFGIEPGYFLWISNFYPYKQAERLIAGYARLDPETRRRHPLVMAGGNWLNGLEAAQAQAANLGIAADVKYLGWIADEWIAPLYRQALAFCLASREETFGRCVIEAMACGAPCVVNDIPIMHEVTGGHALIVDFKDAGAVAAALGQLAAHPATPLRARGMARAGEFTFEKLITERISAIQRLVATRPPTR